MKLREDVFNDFLKGLNFEDVIDGLNKYFAEDETRVRVSRSIVEIRSHNKILFYRFDAEMYLDKLIALLRTEHGIFYYPGMEAKYAKIERIPPLTERLMDEGALNSLKKLHKRVVGEEPEVDSHTLIAYGISHQVSVYEVQIEELKTHISALQKDLRNLDKKDINDLIRDYCMLDCINSWVGSSKELKTHISALQKDIMDHIRREAFQHGYTLPEKVDGEPLTIERAFRELLDLMKIRGEELRMLRSKCDRLNELVGELNTLNNEIKEEST